MPELFGIFNPTGINSEHRHGYSRMRGVFSKFNHIEFSATETSYLLLSTIRNNKHETDYQKILKNEEFITAWIGQAAIFNDDANNSTIFNALIHNDFNNINDFCPPFCAAISKPHGENLWLISDYFGHYPIYYTSHNNTIIFSTKLLPILSSNLFSWKIDTSAVLEFFTYEHVLSNKTFSKEIKLVPPGTVLRFDGNIINKDTYTISNNLKNDIPNTTYDVAKTIYDGLQKSISYACKSSSHTAITLSSGLDSRAILGCAMEHTNSLSAFTFGPEDCRDVKYARELAKRADIAHEVIPTDGNYLIKWLDHGLFITGGMVSCIHYQILSLADTLAQYADLVMDGLGGGTFTGANIKWPMKFARSKANAIDLLYRQRATAWADPSEQKHIFDAEFLFEAGNPKSLLNQYFSDLERSELWRGGENFVFNERQFRFAQFGPHQIRPFVPVHTPFYELDLVRRMRQVNLKHLIGQNAYVYMHKHYFKHLAEIPDSKRGVPITWPASIRFGKRVFDFGVRRLPEPMKRQFGYQNSPGTDYPDWFRNELRELIYDNILGNQSMHEYINIKATENLIQDHMDRNANHTTKLGVLLTFSAWLQSVSNNNLS